MKNSIPLPSFLPARFVACLVLAAVFVLVAMPTASATVYYWDGNGATAGAGTAPTGTWGTSAFWSTNASGLNTTANTATTALDQVRFSAGTDATGTYTVSLNGTRTARQLRLDYGNITFSGGTINLSSNGTSGSASNVTNGIFLDSTAGNATISSNLTINGVQILNIAAGKTLTLNTGTFTRSTGASLNVLSTGTVASSMTGLSSLTNGILGPWATFGSGSSMRYATISGGNIAGLTGTAAATAANVTDTTGAFNYDVAGTSAAFGAGASVNTLRLTGGGGTMSGDITANGLLHAGSGTTTLSGNVTIGSTRELVVTPASNSFIFSGVLKDNGGGASSLLVTQPTNSGVLGLTLSNNNTYSGGTTISNARLSISANNALGTGAVSVLKGGIATVGDYGGQLEVSNNITWSNNMTLAGQGLNGYNGALRNLSGNNTSTGTITIADTTTRISSSSGTLTLNGDINLTTAAAYGFLFFHNQGDIRIGGNITGSATSFSVFGHSSATNFLIFNRANALASPMGIVLGSNNSTGYGRIDLNGFDQTVTTLSALGNATTNDFFNNLITNRSGTLATLTVNSSSSSTFNGTFSGNLALTKNGSGTLTLTSNNTYTGATDVAGGTLLLSGNGTLSNSAVSISGGTLDMGGKSLTNTLSSLTAGTLSNGTLTNNGSNFNLQNGTVSAVLAGTNGVNKTTSGTVTLSGANTYTGTTTISNGALVFQRTAAKSASSTVTVDAAGTLGLGVGNASIDYSNDVVAVFNTGTLTGFTIDAASGIALDTTNGNFNLSSALTAARALTKLGSNTLTLSGASANTYNGTTTVSNGTLTLNKDTNVVAVGGDLVLNGSSKLIYGASKSEQIANTASITINGTQSVFNGSIWADNATPQANINETIASLTVRDGQFNTGTTSNWTVTGAGVFDGSSGDSRFAAFSGSSISFNSLSLTAMNGTEILTHADSFVLGGNQPTVTTLTVGSGGLTLNGSTLSMNLGSVASGNGSRLILNGNITTTGSSASFIGSYNGTNGTTNIQLSSTVGSVDRTITTGSGANLTIGVAITNGNATTAGIIKDGLGTLTLSSNNTYNGVTTVSAGTLNLSTALALQNSTIDTSGAGVITLSSVTAPTFGGLIGGGNLSSVITTGYSSVTGITLNPGSGTSNTYSGVISDGAAGMTLIKTGAGTQVLSGNNTYTGATTVSAGTLQVDGQLGGGSYSGNVSNSGAFIYNGSNSQILSGVISGAGALTKNNTGTLTLSGNNTFTGQLTVAEGTLSVATLNNSGASGVLGNSTNSVILGSSGKNGILSYTGNTTSTVTKTFTMAEGGTGVFDVVGSSGILTVGLISGSGALSKTGDGTLVLGSANTYSGGTTLAGSGLVAVNVDSVGSAGSPTSGAFGTGTVNLAGAQLRAGITVNRTVANAVTISADTTFATTSTEKSLIFTGPVTLSGATRTLNVAIGSTVASSNLTFSGAIGDGGNGYGITKTGTGTLVLSGNNTYTGNTTISAGVLNIQHANALGGTGNGTTVASGAALQLQGGITVSGEALTIAGAGRNSTTAPGALRNISGTNTYAGAINLSAASYIGAAAGTLNLTGGITSTNLNLELTGAGDINVTNNAINLGAGTLTVYGQSATSNASIGVAGNTVGTVRVYYGGRLRTDVADAFSPTAALTMGSTDNSTGRLDLNGNNQTFSSLATSGTGSQVITSASAATLTVNGSSSTTFGGVGGAITGNISLVKAGSSRLTLSGNNTYTGATTINAGTIALTGNISNSATTINSGGTLIGTGTAGAVTVNSGGIIGAGNATGAVGTLTTSSLTINAGSGYTLTIGNVNSSVAGTDYDQISSAGDLAFNNTLANPFTIYLDGTPTGWSNSGNYTWNIISAASQTGFDSGNFALDFANFGIASGNRTGLWNFTNPSAGTIALTYTASTGDAIWSGGAGNWSTGFSPNATTDKNITFSGAGGTATNDITSGTLSSVNFITFNSTAGAYTLAANAGSAGNGSALTVKGDILNNSASTQLINMDLALLTSSTGIVNTATGNIAIGGVISGAGDLTKTGNGTLTLNGSNTYTGATTVSAGALNIQNNNALGTTAGGTTVASGAALQLQGDITVGAEALSLTGTGVSSGGALRNISGNNTFGGPITIAGNTQINSNSGLLTLSGGIITTSGTVTFGGAASHLVSGNVSGSAHIRASNSTVSLTLTGTNTFAGNLIVEAGTVTISSIGNAGEASAAGAGSTISIGLPQGTGTLVYTGSAATSNKTIALSGGPNRSMTINQNGTGLLKFTSNVTSTGLGFRTLVLGGNGSGEMAGAIVDSASGTTMTTATAASGSLQLTLASVDGISVGSSITGATIANGTTITALNGNIATLSNATTGNVTAFTTILTIPGVTNPTGVTKSGTGNWTLSGANTYSGNTTISAGALNIQHANALGTTARGTTVASGAALQLQGNITVGAEALSLTGTGVSTTGALRSISGNNTYGGAITLAGATRINSDADLLTLSGGISGTQNLTIGGAGNTTINSAIATSTGTLTKDGDGTLILSGANTYTGATTINAGNLTISSGSAISDSGVVTLGNATGAILHVAASETIGTLSGGGSNGGDISIAASQALTVNQTATGTFAGIISGSGALTKNGSSTLTLTGSNSYDGVTTINAGTLTISNDTALGSTVGGTTISTSASLNLQGNITVGAEALAFNGGTSGYLRNVSGNNTWNGDITVGTINSRIRSDADLLTIGGNITLNNNGVFEGASNTTVTGVISGGSGLTLGANMGPNAVVTFAGNNTYTGATAISAGTLQIGAGGTSGSLSASTSITNNANLVFNRSDSLTVSNAISGTGNMTQAGAGTLVLTGNNAYNGTTTINAGTLQIGAGGTSGNLSISSSITNNGTLAFNRSGTITQGTNFANSISGTGNLTQAGSGTLVLGGTNSYTGLTTISAGNLSISTVAAVANTSGINLANATSLTYTGGSAATLDRAISVTGTTGSTGTIRNESAGLLTLSGTLSKNGTTLALQGGNGGITVSGSIVGSNANSDLIIDGGSVTLAAANTYNGPTTIKNGATLNANISGALPIANGRSDVLIDPIGSAGSTLVLGASQSIASLSGAASSNVTLGSNTITIGTTSGNTTYAGRITGGSSSALVKDGASTQVLTGNNTGFTGTTTVNGTGTLTAAAAGALGGTTNIDVNGGSLLVAVANAVNSNANINLGGGTLAVSGNFNQNVGLLTLSADSVIDFSSFSGTLRFSGLSWASTSPNAKLAIWNWSGTTEWGTKVNNWQNPSNLVFSDSTNLTANNLAKISFYSDSGDSFVGKGFIDSDFAGPGALIIAVPEPETYITGVLLLLGFTIYQLRLARQGQGLLSRLTFLRQAKRQPLEGQPPA